MNYTQWYAQHGLLQKHEQWFVDNVMLETIVGSHCYGCQTENSDYDVITILLPKYEHLFPQSAGYILGFDELPSFSRKELKGKSRTIVEKKPVEIEWVSLIEFFVHAGLKSSPNLMECLFTRRNFVTVGTSMGYLLRDKRKLFISMKTFKAFCGYANGQMHRIRNRKPETEERQQLIEKYGYDLKMATHTLRLTNQLVQILTDGDIDLMQNKEELKLMRAGEWGDFDRFDKEFQKRMDYLEELSRKSNLAPQPQTGSLRMLLLEILEHHFKLDENKKVGQNEYVSAKEVKEQLDRIEKVLNEKFKN